MTSEIVENQELIAQSVRDLADRHIRPNMREWDETQHLPLDLFRHLGEQGLMGMLVPVAYGGAGLGYREYVTAIVELSRVDGSVGLSMAAHNSLCTNHILMFGNEDQKQRYLPRLATGEWLGTWGLTEPNTGSDAGNMRTTAVREGDNWVLNGAKNFITHGKSGNVAVVIARTGEPNTSQNATAFVVERGTPAFRAAVRKTNWGCGLPKRQRCCFRIAGFPTANGWVR